MKPFAEEILEGIPIQIPEEKPIEPAINHAPKRKEILNADEKKTSTQERVTLFS
jgi:urocanate hydratase